MPDTRRDGRQIRSPKVFYVRICYRFVTIDKADFTRFRVISTFSRYIIKRVYFD